MLSPALCGTAMHLGLEFLGGSEHLVSIYAVEFGSLVQKLAGSSRQIWFVAARMLPGLEFFDALGETGLCRSLHSQWHGGRLGPKIAWLWPNPGGAGHIQLLPTPANDLHTRHTTQPRLANVRLHREQQQQEEEEEEEGALYARHVNNTCKLANNAEWEPQPAVLKWIGSSPARTSPHTRLLAGGRDGARPRGRVGSAAAAGSEHGFPAAGGRGGEVVLQHPLRAHRHRGDGAEDGFLRRPRRLLLRAVSGQRLRGQFCK